MNIRQWSLGILLALCAVNALAQDAEFGKNKVQYKKFNWYYIQSNHFDIYFSDGGEYLADFTAAAAESAYAMISKDFRYQINNRISIMVYNSHNDFQQTNVVSEYLEEGIGGVTELFKNRVVLPFEGNYRMFRHVIHHELVHAVLNDMLYGGSIQSIISNNIRLQLPMWFNEGLAEYESLRWDTNSDMFMRDATIHTYLVPIDYLNGYFAYRGGQSVWYYIANKYGEQKIGEILNRIKATRSVEQGFKSALGLSVSELNERWQKELKVMYWPDIAKRDDPADFATRMTDHYKDGNFYNTSPAISPQGDKIAFISDRDEYFDVYIMSTIDHRVMKIINGQQTKNFEELHLLTPGITWSPDGKKIALAVKSGDQDAIFIVDVASGDKEQLEFSLDGIFSVNWSHQGDKLTFIGDKDERSDIYVYDLKAKELTNLTDDAFSDADPVWSPDGTTIYFSSDRGNHLSLQSRPQDFQMAHYDFSQLDLYAINVQTKEIRRITDYPHSDETSPALSSDGKTMLYISDRNGINNIYERNLVTGDDRPITNSIAGVYQLSVSTDGSKLAFSALDHAGFDIFVMKLPFEKKLSIASLEPTEFMKSLIGEPIPSVAAALDSTAAKKDSTAMAAANNSAADSSGVYGKNVRIDFGTYVFADESRKEKEKKLDLFGSSDDKKFSLTDNMDENGNYKVNKYKLNFTPDIIYGNAGYSTFYGVEGTTAMAFSDMLGDHQIYFLTNLLLDLKNSDYMFAYYYLPKRTDFGIQGFHSARFLYMDDPNLLSTALYRFQTWGIGGSASYPFDRFNRMDVELMWLNLSMENLDFNFEPAERRSLIIPQISYIHDNTLWGYTAPNNGTRYNISGMFSPSLGQNSLNFQTFTLDYRTYFPFWHNYDFVVRWSGGASLGANPQRFFIGGTDGWINREFENNTIPIQSVADYAFLTPALPLRGFNYNAQNGTKFALMNYELRFPLIQYLVTGGVPLAFQNITGVTFFDVGSAWTNTDKWQGLAKSPSGSTVTKDLLVGTGFGVRIILFGLPLRFDVAWSYNIAGFSIPKYYISLGEDF
ncbi:MAG: PD40 domain-containing protein [Bacteroidota bacterium]|nr:PD40 domain-containing protein [Bacteroidota bacterium]